MTDSMMPEGVEHTKSQTLYSVIFGVTDSMMPEGVEHYGLPTAGTRLQCDRFHDAGRR